MIAGIFSSGCVAFVEILERQEDRGGVRLVAAEEIEAGDFHRVEHAGRFARDLCDLVDDGLRAIERGGVGELRKGDGVAAILRREKTAGHDFESERGQPEQPGIDQEHDDREPSEPCDGVAVGIPAQAKTLLKPEEPAEQTVEQALEPVLLRAVRLEQERGERGRKGERVERGDGGRDGDGQRELAEELAR